MNFSPYLFCGRRFIFFFRLSLSLSLLCLFSFRISARLASTHTPSLFTSRHTLKIERTREKNTMHVNVNDEKKKT